MPPRGALQIRVADTLLRPRSPHHRPRQPVLNCVSAPRRPFSLPSLSIPGLRLPAAPEQTIQARRVLRYPKEQVYDLIADVDSYSSFLPFCTSSRVTSWVKPALTPGTTTSTSIAPRRWPARADLTVGWGPITESYTSRLYCVPGEIVEAVSGRATTSLPVETLRRLGLVSEDGYDGDATADNDGLGVFDSLLTRWALRPVFVSTGEEMKKTTIESATGVGRQGGSRDDSATEVTLSIRFRFSNPAYGLAVGSVADDMVGMMIEAFERRARQVYGR
ncbi:hypothetical protein VTK73DRAFT_8175 [Phialemonium thermophilum]|uniref:Coenzyme Q-binding protein COQ10 START domain-containing protein n=1 Tax=Phialemonium thermophilum TaxID=223376 RepID=A0ABR3XQP9_9PEZI